MPARRFFLVSLGILALSIAYHLGARTARADWQPAAQGRIIGVASRAVNNWMAITSSGEYSIVNDQVGWSPTGMLAFPPGVSPADVKFFDGGQGDFLLITNWDEAWTSSGGGEPWESKGIFPGGPTPTQSTSWGEIKGKGGQ